MTMVFERLLGMSSGADGDGNPEPFAMPLTPEAKEVWVEYYNRHRAELRDLDDDLAAAWSKQEAYAARFALIFQLCSWADDNANPFSQMQSVTIQANSKRLYFVTRAEASKVLDACPDAQWRLLFALSRYGGLRCPSEHLALRWGDVDWAANRITIHSPKTEHHDGKECRIIPLFPELRPYLEQAFDEADPGTEFVITRYRNANSNLRSQLCRILKLAGLKPWPKLFQNLRSTRETELAERFPIHVVCEWIGNSQAVAAKHYLQTTDEHYAVAASRPTGAVQNPVQLDAVSPGNGSSAETQKTIVAGNLATFSAYSSDKVTPTGLEPVLPA